MSARGRGSESAVAGATTGAAAHPLDFADPPVYDWRSRRRLDAYRVSFGRSAMLLAMRIIGALLFVGGIVYLVVSGIYRGRFSDATADPADTPAHTLEPPNRGIRFIGARHHWPGLVMIALGILLLLVLPLVFGPPRP